MEDIPQSAEEMMREIEKCNELADKIASGRVEVLVVPKNSLPLCQNIGQVCGSKVEKVADEGGLFPVLIIQYERISEKTGKPEITMSRVRVEKGNIAISVEIPKGNESHSVFGEALRMHAQRKPQFPSKSTAKS